MKFRVGQKIVIVAEDAQVNQGAAAKVIAIDEKDSTPFAIRINGNGWRTWVTPVQIAHENAIDGLAGLAEDP